MRLLSFFCIAQVRLDSWWQSCSQYSDPVWCLLNHVVSWWPHPIEWSSFRWRYHLRIGPDGVSVFWHYHIRHVNVEEQRWHHCPLLDSCFEISSTKIFVSYWTRICRCGINEPTIWFILWATPSYQALL